MERASLAKKFAVLPPAPEICRIGQLYDDPVAYEETSNWGSQIVSKSNIICLYLNFHIHAPLRQENKADIPLPIVNMPPSKPKSKSASKSSRGGTDTTWSHGFDTLRRENLFRNPPTDHTAYPALKAAIAPHIESFNALLEKDGLIAQGLLDIGTKTYLDGDERMGPTGKNKLAVKIKEVFVEKSVLPASNKFSTKNREILPSECRERHVTYRGKMTARLEYRVNNGDPKECLRDLGQLPLMLMVGASPISGGL